MPMNRDNYPPDWEAISMRIRRERARWHCEKCGKPNHEQVLVGKHGEWYDEGVDLWRDDHGNVIDGYSGEVRRVKVVLTVAHLNHNTRDNRDDNLMALCQRCHLRLDAQQHVETRRRNRHKGQRKLPLVDDEGQR